MNKLSSFYPSHVNELQQRYKNALSRDNLDVAIIHSGQEVKAFLDDLQLSL